ncbi:Tagatose-6-phosphate ketose/aldose isomerase [Sodalis praecaptivus]|uniref:Tagatose-6-phosphate ketose/aldose isomerase n=1 Tax=Sodalis praecaptivus TaxID=1239307 RepID=W0HXY0_9GAMM|nr:SIS domain-containing protein [Sodalis praecaptivus]AHF78726.1 Tagatose-6-phosphate ketose/aldose isomerase [Sodalis praecaptivus]
MTEFFGYSNAWLNEHQAQHTAREIWQQPAVWRALHRQLTADRPYWQSFLAPLLADPRLQIVLTGAGSSAFAGRALAPWLRQQTGRDVKAYGTTDIVANPYHYLDPSRPLLLVSFARSGNSPESVAAVALADQCVPACHHLLLVCNPDSQLCDWAAGKAHVCTQVMPEGTHDKSFAMTSSFSSMLLAGLLLLGPQDIAQTAAPLARMADECEQLLVRRQPQVKALAAGGYRRYIVVGGSCFTGLAEEAALKMLELTAGNVATRFDSSLGLRHGPKFMVDGHTLLLVLFSADPYARQYDRDLWQELRRDGLAGVLCAFGGAGEAVEGVDVIYREDNDAWLMFPYLLLTQMLAFETSLALGITPDNPSPGGSVNRVVQGVSIYPYAGAPAAAGDRSDKRGSACI